MSGPLGSLPPGAGGSSLPFRNLRRGVSFGLPSGERVAKALGLKPLGDDELTVNGKKLTDLGFQPGKTPLWFYILKEAELDPKGEHLGPVGGRIVGEVFLGLLKGDAKSYLNQDPRWQPFLGTTMADLVAFAHGLTAQTREATPTVSRPARSTTPERSRNSSARRR